MNMPLLSTATLAVDDLFFPPQVHYCFSSVVTLLCSTRHFVWFVLGQTKISKALRCKMTILKRSWFSLEERESEPHNVCSFARWRSFQYHWNILADLKHQSMLRRQLLNPNWPFSPTSPPHCRRRQAATRATSGHVEPQAAASGESSSYDSEWWGVHRTRVALIEWCCDVM